MALFADDNGLYFYKKILEQAKDYLNDRFIIAFEIGYLQAKEITNFISEKYSDVKVSIEKDLTGKDRYIFIIKE